MSESQKSEIDYDGAFASAREFRRNEPIESGTTVSVPLDLSKRMMEFIGYTNHNTAILRDPTLPKKLQDKEFNVEDVVRSEDLKFFVIGFYQNKVPVIFPKPTNSAEEMNRNSVQDLIAFMDKKKEE